ncbi:SH3 domain-binding protein 5-like [Caerostris darwini]|uniref:SH3 domain-binding protein 5-like n=1 Tax=Caerostris darwini TaxID=1538125 RepID=A0AAV4X4G7_9ARAC|nr:SH3 domain-binding protein 5-like [Caerostris darwini]
MENRFNIIKYLRKIIWSVFDMILPFNSEFSSQAVFRFLLEKNHGRGTVYELNRFEGYIFLTMSNDASNDMLKDNETKSINTDEVPLEELVDPRVQVELERLNTATDAINKLEIELDDARANFRLLLSESSMRVNQLANKLGACVDKARPYYEARMHAKQLQTQTQKAALRYERASSAHSAAKEMVYLAEEGLKKEGRCFDPAWQEMLNHATLRVNEAESERVLSQHDHQKTSLAYNDAEKIVQHLHQEIRKSIVKSRPYFEMKAQFNQLLEEQRKKVHHLEEKILKMKMSYADALHNLEEISDEIHQKRKSKDSTLPAELNKIEGAESSQMSCDGIKLPYHKLKSSFSSSENISMENLNMEDMYMSLPSKITLRPDIIAASCVGSNSWKRRSYPASKSEGLEESSEDKMQSVPKMSEKSNVQYDKINNSLNEKQVSQLDKNSSVPNHPEFISTSVEDTHEETKSKVFDDVLLEEEEIPECKFLSPDPYILRIHREELSDSESLASTDTTDTLDDNQIECLLLEKVLPVEMKESEKAFNDNKADENHL